ncbi:MAG: carbohydrate binding family 9 domain-containing protein [Ignavibacteriae bacterium]|nr:carbohydrate binding family 9 domain-containing protein [Ignavibacteriota bacterium]
MRSFLLSLLILISSSFKAQSAEPTRSLEAVRTSESIRVDGLFTESIWEGAGVSDFIQKDPDEGKPATQRTVVWVAYDDAALYVAARLFDTAPDSIISRIGRRDADLSADWFYFGIDSYNDKRTGFYFGVYSGGTMVDGTIYNDSWDDNSWDGIWESATVIDDDGWTVEMKIPYSQIRFPKQDEYTWGVNFGRNIERRKEESWFVMVPKNESGWVSRFPPLRGIRNINPPARIEVLPYAASSAEFIRHDAGDPFNDGSRFFHHVGADVKVGLGSNLTLNATINPDFGQVEVDPAVVNLTQFETFFQEKRPFFIEGFNFFSFGFGGANNNWGFNWGTPEFFYTRRVGRAPQGDVLHDGFTDIPKSTTILAAGKITGKVADGWSLGSLHAFTAREWGHVDSSGHRLSNVVEPFAYNGIVRTLGEFNNGRQALGVIGTAVVRDLNQPYLLSDFNKKAYALGMDGWTNLDEDQTWVVTGWVAASRIEATKERLVSVQRGSLHYYQRPDIDYLRVDSTRTSLSGYAGRVALNKQKGNFYLNSAFGVVSPGFESNDLGFLFRTDVLNGHVVAGYRWYEPDGFFRRKDFTVATFRNYDFGGRIIGNGYFLFYNAQFMNYWSMWGNLIFNPAVYDTRNTRGGPAMRTTNGYVSYTGFDSDSREPLIVSFELGAGRTESGGFRTDITPGINWKPTAGLNVRLFPTITHDVTVAYWVGSQEDLTATHTYGTRYVFGRLDQNEISASIRIDWTFTPKLSLQLYLQPLISVGKYTDFKELKEPGTYTFNNYGEGASTITPQIESDGSVNSYVVDPDGVGPAAPFSFDNPNFNYKSLRANAILRWEFLPGSTIYLAWTQSKVNESHPGEFRFGRDFSDLLSTQPDNVLLVKISYWVNP